MVAPVTAYIGLGANLGDAANTIALAFERLDTSASTRVTARSSLYRSAPLDAAGPDFLNAVAALATGLSAPDLLRELQRLETEAGRLRPYRNAPRTLDLDLLLYGDLRLDTPTLTLPHPRLRERAFVLRPLAEIAPQQVSAALLKAVAAQRIEKLEPPP